MKKTYRVTLSYPGRRDATTTVTATTENGAIRKAQELYAEELVPDRSTQVGRRRYADELDLIGVAGVAVVCAGSRGRAA